MKKKWWIIAAATIAACIGLAFVIPALRPPRPGVTKENFDRIKIGMMQAELELIFGAPPTAVGPREGLCEWESEFGDLAVILCDTEGRVVVAEWEGLPDDRSLMQKLLDSLLQRERPKLDRFRS